MTEKKEIRYIVRIINKDLTGTSQIYKAVQEIKGIGQRMGKNIAEAFEKETGVSRHTRIGEMTEDLDQKLEDIVLHPDKHGLPKWTLNRQRDFETGATTHMVMSELDFAIRKDLQRLNQIKSYRGLRHSWGLPVRGQKTKSTHRGKGGVVGVTKKDAKGGASASAAKPAAPAKPAAKK
ncbi:MAG: 30S ribosomal protein S13 [Candidatus Diapherotrites archaeon]|uniref:30S ribosomal protein S13 n=1 Tax=Candidatus Iainarchaeum sp. TaxID=3101447 RepID=A0A8T4L6B3_9ARCH|nr:30S ribosomal protein S13 [Candidatus Diapherotrites archaeon]